MEDSIFDVEQLVVAVKLSSAQNEVALEQATSGVTSADLDEVLARARRVKLFNGRFESSNFFSFRLPSGASAIGRLIPQRGKPPVSGEFFFQCLIATSEVFYNCGADPVRLALHAMNSTFFSAYQPGAALKKFTLKEPVSCANIGEVRRTVDKIGAHTVAVLIQALFQYEQTYFVTDYHAFLLVSNVFSLLPVFARRELSFSVGLFFSGDRSSNFVGVTLPKRIPFRSRETLEAESFLDLRDVAENGSEYSVDAPWASLVEDVLERDLGDSFFFRIAKSFLDETPELERDLDSKALLEEVEELTDEWREFFDSDLGDKLENFEEFSNGGFDEDDEESEFGSLTGWRDSESDSDGEEWKQGNAYGADSFEDFLTGAEDVDDDEEEGQEDETLHKVRFVEIPGNHGEDAQNQAPDARKRADRGDLDVRNLTAADVERFLESLLNREERDEAEKRANGDEINFAPFVLLSVEFPEYNAQLRRLDALVVCALSGNTMAKREFVEFWKNFCSKSEKGTTKRVREVYFQNLLVAVKQDDDAPDDAREEQIKNIFELATIMAE